MGCMCVGMGNVVVEKALEIMEGTVSMMLLGRWGGVLVLHEGGSATETKARRGRF